MTGLPVNETLAAVLAGLLLSISAGVRITVPLLVLGLLAWKQVIGLPHDLAWMGTPTSLILLAAAFVAETIIHFIPAAGTFVRTLATPLAFVAGTLIMAVPLGDRSPLFQWVLAGTVGGGTALLTHLGTTGTRVVTGPANLATGGIFGLGWNLLEMGGSILLVFLGGLCVVAGWIVGAVILCALAIGAFLLFRCAWRRPASSSPF